VKYAVDIHAYVEKMSDKSSSEWTDATWNPPEKHCYAKPFLSISEGCLDS
jgi:protein gp37